MYGITMRNAKLRNIYVSRNLNREGYRRIQENTGDAGGYRRIQEDIGEYRRI